MLHFSFLFYPFDKYVSREKARRKNLLLYTYHVRPNVMLFSILLVCFVIVASLLQPRCSPFCKTFFLQEPIFSLGELQTFVGLPFFFVFLTARHTYTQTLQKRKRKFCGEKKKRVFCSNEINFRLLLLLLLRSIMNLEAAQLTRVFFKGESRQYSASKIRSIKKVWWWWCCAFKLFYVHVYVLVSSL